MKHSLSVARSSSLVDLSRAQINKVGRDFERLRLTMDSSLALAGNDPSSCRHCMSPSLVRFGFPGQNFA